MWSPCLTATLPLQILSTYTHSAQLLYPLHAAFTACSNTNKLTGYLGLFRLFYDFFFIKTCIFFISKHFLTMVLVLKNENISLSCTIYSQLSVQHVHRPQALASCIYNILYIQASCILYLLFPVARRVSCMFVNRNMVRRNWMKRNSLYRHVLRMTWLALAADS